MQKPARLIDVFAAWFPGEKAAIYKQGEVGGVVHMDASAIALLEFATDAPLDVARPTVMTKLAS